MSERMDVEQLQAHVSVPLGGSATQAYTIYGVSGAGKTDITSSCSLALDTSFGTATGGTVAVRPHGGTTTITATCGALSGTSQLTVNLTGTVIIGMNTPMNAPSIF